MIRRAVRGWKRLYWRLRPRLPLRTKVSVFFGLLALAASVSITVVTYTIARTSLLDERSADAKGQAISNAHTLNAFLRAEEHLDEDFGDTFNQRLVAEEGGFRLAVLDDGRDFGDFGFAEAFPPELRSVVDSDGSGIQRFSFAGERYIGVGIHLAGPDADYYEAFPLRSTERTLRSLLIAFSIGSATTVALASGIGVWTSRRLMRPLARITDAATQIASGDLDSRVPPEHDRDLEALVTSFNGMADAVQTRIQREERFASDVSH